MIHHLSIAARDPEHIAHVFAELLDGVCIPFPPNPGAFIALAGDAHGTAVEVYPAESVLRPNGPAGADFIRTEQAEALSPVHFALSVEHSLADIEAIAAREGWEFQVCSRGGDFDVAELWLENRFLVELLPPDFAAGYLRFAGAVARSDQPASLMAGHERLTRG